MSPLPHHLLRWLLPASTAQLLILGGCSFFSGWPGWYSLGPLAIPSSLVGSSATPACPVWYWVPQSLGSGQRGSGSGTGRVSQVWSGLTGGGVLELGPGSLPARGSQSAVRAPEAAKTCSVPKELALPIL